MNLDKKNVLEFPINSFEVDVLGPPDGNFAGFVSGAGVIKYRVLRGQLTCTSGGLPPSPCTPQWPRSGTSSETSNISYGPLCPSGRFVALGAFNASALSWLEISQLFSAPAQTPVKLTEMPFITGLQYTKAVALVDAAGLDLMVTDVPTDNELEWNKVLTQNPSGGTSIGKGALVYLSVGVNPYSGGGSGGHQKGEPK